MSSDTFTKFMNDLNRLIMELVNSTHNEEKMGGIMVIGTAPTVKRILTFRVRVRVYVYERMCVYLFICVYFVHSCS
jgi:hypothetical protein